MKIKLKLHKHIVAYRLPKSIKEEIRLELTMTNPKYIENKKMGRYNRNTPKYLFLYRDIDKRMILPLGYIEPLMSKLTSNKHPFDLFESQNNRPIKITFNGKLKDYQVDAVKNIIPYNYSTLESPTGSGKTVIGLYTIAVRRQRTLIIVHTKELLYQWINRASSFLSIKKSEIGIIGNSKNIIGKRLTIALVQSLYNKIDKLKNTFGYIIVDECHRAPSRVFSQAIGSLNALYQLGLTATPYRRDKLTKLIHLYVGPVRHSVPMKKLRNDGQIVPAKFIIRSTEFNSDYDPISDYSKMLSELTKDKNRNNLICEDISSMVFQDNTCLVLSDRKAHCKELQKILFENHKIYGQCLTGDTKQKARKEIVKMANENTCKIIFATGQLIGEGFDCQNLSAMFITTPINYAGRVIQYIGRVLRPCKGKDIAIIFDYADWNVVQLRRSAHKRIGIYGKENVTIE